MDGEPMKKEEPVIREELRDTLTQAKVSEEDIQKAMARLKKSQKEFLEARLIGIRAVRPPAPAKAEPNPDTGKPDAAPLDTPPYEMNDMQAQINAIRADLAGLIAASDTDDAFGLPHKIRTPQKNRTLAA